MHVHDLFVPAPVKSDPFRESILCRRWCGDSAPRFVVGIIHGLGEHAQRYAHVAEYLVSRGGTVLAIDQRGHGKTGGPLPHFEVLVQDVEHFETYLQQSYSGVPIFLYGQSLGGSVVINYLLRKTNRLTGAISTSPLLRTTFPPPAWKLTVAKMLGKWWPNLTLSTAIKPTELSHDPLAVRAYIDDPIVHQRVSAALGLSMLEAGQWAIQHAGDLKTPLLLMHGTEDRITSHAASKQFAQRAGENCTWIDWPGLYHDMHWEPQRDQLLRAIADFIDRQIACAKNQAARPG